MGTRAAGGIRTSGSAATAAGCALPPTTKCDSGSQHRQPFGRSAMALTQQEKCVRFRALHEGPGAFVIPNPWDGGSAKVFASLGFKALATSSSAAAGTLGRRDGQMTRDEALAHARV